MGFTGTVSSDQAHFEEFVCAICVQLVDLEESVLTSCSHVFCASCLLQWLERKKSCPTCQRDLGLASTSQLPLLKHGSPLAWRVLSRVRVRCPLEGGCAWVGDYSELQGHLASASAHADAQANPKSVRETAMALKEQANERYTARNFHDAVRLYSKAVSLCDDIPALFANRAAVYLALSEFDKALADSKRAVELDAAYAKGWVRGSKALVGLGRFEEAAAFLEGCPAAVLASNPAVAKEQRAVRAQAERVRAAEEALAAGDYSKAREQTTPLLACTTASRVLLLAARAECEVGSIERALKLALQVLRANPNTDPAAYVVRALAMFYSAQVEEAVKYVKEALRLSPDDQGAMSAFKRIRRVRNGLAAADAAAAGRKHAEAVETLSELLREADGPELRLPPRAILRATLLGERANSLFRLGEHARALKDCTTAVYLQEDNKRAWLTKSYVLHAEGRHEEALKDMEFLMQRWGANDAVIRGAHEKAQFEVRKAKRPDYYALLTPTGGHPLSSLSSEVEIKAAYKRAALECHPDRLGPEASAQDRQKAEARFKLMGEGLEILTDSFKRKLFDEGFDKAAIEERVRRASEQHSGRGGGGGGGHHHGH